MAKNELDQFDALLSSIQNGSPLAAEEFVRTFGPHIRRVVRASISNRMRTKFDSVDFEQAVWASFFRNPGNLPEFKEPNALIAYLVGMARNMVGEEVRRQTTQKKDIHRERGWCENEAEAKQFRSRDPSPSQLAIAHEELDRLLSMHPAPYRRLVELKLGGASVNEIAAELGVHERTVRKMVAKLKSGSEVKVHRTE